MTSVGGTTLTGDPSNLNSLLEVGNTLSGGGFSAYFPRHDYQIAAVEAFLHKLGSQYFGYFECVCSVGLTQQFLLCNLCSPNGRGVPDIALQSSRYIMVLLPRDLDDTKTYHQANGTSCATIVRLYDFYPLLHSSALHRPFSSTRLNSDVQTAAATISWINDYLISEGKSPLGFLNPWLYGIGWLGFNDITTGRNPGCGTLGFEASEGWDPVRSTLVPSFSTALIRNPLGHWLWIAGLSIATKSSYSPSSGAKPAWQWDFTLKIPNTTQKHSFSSTVVCLLFWFWPTRARRYQYML